jgi:transposase
MRPKGSASVLEARRHRAWALLQEGLSLNAVARRLGCAASSVLRWRHAVRRYGADGFRVDASPGRPPKLTAAQRHRLARRLLRGPLAAGYQTDLWTTARIAELIRRQFHVRYHPDHVGRLLHAMNWSSQKPESRALERDEAAIATWKARHWPRVKQTPRGWAPISSSSTNRASC